MGPRVITRVLMKGGGVRVRDRGGDVIMEPEGDRGTWGIPWP